VDDRITIGINDVFRLGIYNCTYNVRHSICFSSDYNSCTTDTYF